MAKNFLSIALAFSLQICVIICTLQTLSTMMSEINFTKFTPPRRNSQGYRNFNISRRNIKSPTGLLFKDYIMKYNPNVVFGRLDKKKKSQGLNASVVEDFNEILEGIDPTEDLLRLSFEGVGSGRRKWIPPGVPDTEAPKKKDLFSLRQRIFELMRHTMYRTRNKLVIMQILRARHRNSSLYKMGFLMSKTDTACKSFAAYAYRSIHACISRYEGTTSRHELISLLTAEERLNNKWFEIELLIDLILKNHDAARDTLAKHIKGRKQKWKFED